MLCCIARSLCLPLALCFTPAGCAEGERERSAGEGRAAKENAGEECVAQATPWGPVRVELSASAKEYVQGQPIRLTVVLTNRRDTALRFHRIPLSLWEPACLFLSKDGKGFLPCEPERREAVLKMELATDTLQPGGSTTYRFRALHGWKSQDSLGLTQPGRLWIQVRYPIAEWSLERPYRRIGQFEAHSNTVEVQIREAIGVDATVWKTLQGERLLRFLQFDSEDIATVTEALALAKAHPTSSYYPDLKASLEAYYNRTARHGMSQVRSDPKSRALFEELRQWPGIVKPEDLPFPDDKRLSVKFTTSSADSMSLPELCKDVSRLTKVPLSVAPDFAEREMYGGWRDSDLRSLMQFLAADYGEWIRDGDGYKLVPKPKDKAAPAEGPR